MQSVDELIESALSENVDIAVNCGGSFGGGVLVTHDDMFKIKGVWDIFSEAERYRAAEEFDKAAPLYEQAAAAGYNKAQNNLAVLLQNGAKNVPADIERAIYWYEKASATLGVSAFSLGRIYDVGRLVPQDFQKAAHYYLKAAKLGHATAMLNIGIMYIHGEGVEQNKGLGMAYIADAARLGEPNAVALLSKLKKQV